MFDRMNGKLTMRCLVDRVFCLSVLFGMVGLAACEKTQERPLPNPVPTVQKVELASTPLEVEMTGTFKCPVPDSLKNRVAAVELKAERNGEPPEKDEPPYPAFFMTDSVDLILLDGATVKIKLDDSMGFKVTGQGKHEGCDGFRWMSMDDLTIFEYLYGHANPYPGQQLLYSRGAMREFADLYLLLEGAGSFFETDGSNCLTGLFKGYGESKKWCYQNGEFHLNRKMLGEPYSDKSEYLFICDFSGPVPQVVEPVLKTGIDRVPVDPANDEVMKVFSSRCQDFKAAVKPKVLAASQ
jgi:hypothetical protein